MNQANVQHRISTTSAPGSGALRLGVVTTAAPPSPNGQARVLGQIITPAAFAPPIFMTDQMSILETEGERFGRYYALSPPRFYLTTQAWGRALPRLNHGGGLAGTILTRANQIRTTLRRDPADIIIGCSGNPFDLTAAYLAARFIRLPFVAYLFDDPIYQWEEGDYRRLARFAERIWSRGAAAIIAPNEVLASDVQDRLPHAKIHIVRNPVDPAVFATVGGETIENKARNPDTGAPLRLVYTGSVYSAQASAFRNLVAALNGLDGKFTLGIHTAQLSSDLVSKQLSSPHVSANPHTPHDAALKLQQGADILFLPLAFDSPIPEVIRSSAPAKLGEYLAAGRPILVHAPAGSFVTELIRNADAGVVVDTPDPRKLASALLSIAGDQALRARISLNALQLAREFRVDTARKAFLSALSGL
jgi:glycosyltransferase involved in cell wall biosynthesis